MFTSRNDELSKIVPCNTVCDITQANLVPKVSLLPARREDDRPWELELIPELCFFWTAPIGSVYFRLSTFAARKGVDSLCSNYSVKSVK